MKSYLNEKNIYMIGIAGGSAAGKTYLLKALRKVFRPEEVCVISQDDYYRPIEQQQKDDKGMVNFDLPAAIDADAFLEDVKKLSHNIKVTRKEYTFNTGAAEGKTITLQPAPVVVVEGLFILHIPEIKQQLDLKIFLDSRDDIKLNRRLARDVKERGYTEEMILYQWHNHVYPAYRLYLLPYRDEADVIITNNYSFHKGLELIIDHIQSVLSWRESRQSGKASAGIAES